MVIGDAAQSPRRLGVIPPTTSSFSDNLATRQSSRALRSRTSAIPETASDRFLDPGRSVGDKSVAIDSALAALP